MFHHFHNNDLSNATFSESPSDCLSTSTEETRFNVPTNKKDKPRRNRSAFIIFSSEMRSLMKAEEKKKLNSNEMMVKLADLWKNLKEEDKKRYNDMANKEKVKYLVELNQFYQTHPYDVIQNKTKKNHVKKPCSAYGLFLKEAKKAVKAEKPELKMADVLKIVADKWKKLDDKQKAVYQEQAKAEKEVIKTKMTEQANIDEETNLMFLPQKRLQSQKRVKKALIRENLKIQDNLSDNIKAEEVETNASSPFEEAVFAPSNQFETFNGYSDDTFLLTTIPTYNLNYNRMPSVEPIFQSYTKEEDTTQTGCAQRELFELKPKKSNEFIMDLLNFHSQKEERFPSVKNSFISKAPSTCATFANQAAKTSRQAINDTLFSVLAFEPASTEFEFDFFHFDNMGEMNF